MSVQSLLVLGSVVAALPVTGETDFLTLAMLLPVVFIEQMFVAVAFVTNIADVFLRDVILHVKKEFLGGQFGGCTVATLVEVAPVTCFLLV